jgi:PRC-barrel domain
LHLPEPAGTRYRMLLETLAKKYYKELTPLFVDGRGNRFPQKVKVGDLIGLPMLDDNDVTLGRVQRVVRTPEGKIKLIVGYSKWFGWFGRPVAVPIEVVAILARQIASLDMPPENTRRRRPGPKARTFRFPIARSSASP